MAASSRNTAYKIDLDGVVYKNAYAEGDTKGIEGILETSVSWTNREEAKTIFENFLKDYTFDASTFVTWKSSVSDFISDVSDAIKGGYGEFTGTSETPVLSGLMEIILSRLSPSFKETYIETRKSEYDDMTIRDVMDFYTPSNDAQRQVDSRLASEVASGMNNVRSATSEVTSRSTSYTVQDSINKVSERAQTVGITVNQSTSPSSYVCVADEVYDASGQVDEEQTDELNTSREAYETMQEILTSTSAMYTPYEAQTILEDTSSSIMNILNTTFAFTVSDTGKDDTLVQVSKGAYVLSSSLVPASEPSDAKRLKENIDDVLVHDNRIKLDTLNADSIERDWILPEHEFNERKKAWVEELQQDWELHNETGPRTANPPNRSYVSGEPAVDKENRRISVAKGGGFQLDDQVTVTKNTSWFEYGMKIVEIPPVGVDMGTFGDVEEIVIKSRIESVGTLSSNADIQNPVPPAGQNAIGFYYSKHNARALSFSFELHQQEYPDEPLSSIARRLDAFTRPYQYQDLHVEPRRCRIHLPGMTYEGYISTASCSFKGDLYTSWNEGVPQSETGSVQNDTQEQYSYGILTCSLTFLIDEQIQLKQVKTDEAFSIPEKAESELHSSVSSEELIKQIVDNMPVPLDAGTAQRLFEGTDRFLLEDFLNIRKWFKDIHSYVFNHTNDELYKQWDENTGGFISLAMIAFEIFDTIMAGSDKAMLNKLTYTQVVNRTGSFLSFLANDPDKDLKPLFENYIDLTDDSTFSSENIWNAIKITGAIIAIGAALVVTGVIALGAIACATAFAGAGLGVGGVIAGAALGASVMAGAIGTGTIISVLVGLVLEFSDEIASAIYYSTGKTKNENTGLTAEDFVEFFNTCDKHNVPNVLKSLCNELVEIRKTVNITEKAISAFSQALNQISYTIPSGTPIDEAGMHPIIHNGESVLIRVSFQSCVLVSRGLAKHAVELSNKSSQNLSDTVQEEATNLVQGLDSLHINADETDTVANIAATSHNTEGRLADFIQLCRDVETCRIKLNSITADLREYESTMKALKQDLAAWYNYAITDGFKFKCQYFAGIYHESKSWEDLDEVSCGNGKGDTEYFTLREFIEYDDKLSTWRHKTPWYVEAELPVLGTLIDANCQIPFDWYLQAGIYDLCNNGKIDYTGGGRTHSAPNDGYPYTDKKSNIYEKDGTAMNVTDEDVMRNRFRIAVLLSVGVNESALYGSNLWELWSYDYDKWDDWAKNNLQDASEKSRRNFGKKYMQSLVSRTDELLNNLKQGLTKRNQSIEETLALELYRIMHDELNWNLPNRMKSYPEILQEILDFPLRLVLTIETIGMPWSVYDIHNDNTIGVKSTVKLKYLSPDSDSSLHEITWGEISGWIQSISGMNYDTRVQGWYLDTNYKLKKAVVTKDGVQQEAAMTMNDLFPGIEDTDPLRNSILNRIAGWFYDRNGQKTSIAETLDRLGYKYPEL